MAKVLVICSDCGGQGYREFLQEDGTWEQVKCPDCKGQRYIEVEEFDPNKREIKKPSEECKL